ncbi:hypothetical protein CAXC1_40013 [Candidatus Xenohaliotis californiensis]|uniref:Ribosome-binding factor A n=1 Tax=Candidatus Xenohaliotis californiensis TaxID=84677 RepID=A0ABP0EX76_9RICK|nr:hypothetical protein CAXC1_40013 [Candidatus Xenohaliotis californiensis]
MVHHGDLQYRKKRMPRWKKVSCLIQQLVADFVCDYLSMPVTVSRAEITKDLSMAKVFFITPHPALANKVGFRNIVLRMLPENLLNKIQYIEDNDMLFLCYLNYMHPKICAHIFKSSKLRKIPAISFFIEQEDFYNKKY